RVRHEVVPRLAGIASGAARNAGEALAKRGALAKRVGSTLREVRSARRALGRRARLLVESVESFEGRWLSLDCSRITREADPVVALAIQRAGGSLGLDKDLTRPALRGVLRRALGSGDGRRNLTSGWVAVRRGPTLRIGPSRPGIEVGAPLDVPARPLSVPGRVRLQGADVRASWLDGPGARRGVGGGEGGV